MKSVTQVFEVLAYVALLLGGSSCSLPWGNLPPTTYHGRVVHDELGTGVPNATITASRPCVRSLWPLVNPEVLATTKSDEHGNFLMTTKTGYATQIVSRTGDGKLNGRFEPSRKSGDPMKLKVSPGLSQVTYRRKGNKYVDRESPSSKVADAAMQRLVKYISAHPGAPLRSLNQYNKQGVISENELLVFKTAPDHYFGTDSLVEYVWGHDALLIPNQKAPIRLVPSRNFL